MEVIYAIPYKLKLYAIAYILVALMCLGISGCAASSEELYTKAVDCELSPETKGVACDQLWEEWNRREDQLEVLRKKKAFMNQCKIYGDAYYSYCYNDTMERCWVNKQKDRGGHCLCTCVKGGWN